MPVMYVCIGELFILIPKPTTKSFSKFGKFLEHATTIFNFVCKVNGGLEQKINMVILPIKSEHLSIILLVLVNNHIYIAKPLTV